MQSSGPVSLIPGPNEHLVKYFGSVAVDIGTGVETVQNAVKVRSFPIFLYLSVRQKFALNIYNLCIYMFFCLL